MVIPLSKRMGPCLNIFLETKSFTWCLKELVLVAANKSFFIAQSKLHSVNLYVDKLKKKIWESKQIFIYVSMFLITSIFLCKIFCSCEKKTFLQKFNFRDWQAITYQTLLTRWFKQRGLPYNYKKICDIGTNLFFEAFEITTLSVEAEKQLARRPSVTLIQGRYRLSVQKWTMLWRRVHTALLTCNTS